MYRLLTTHAERVGVSPVAFPSLSGCGLLSLCRLTGAAERVRYIAGCAREPAERNFPQPFTSHKATGKAPILSERSTMRHPGRARFAPASHPFAQCAGRRWAVGLCPSSPALQPDGGGRSMPLPAAGRNICRLAALVGTCGRGCGQPHRLRGFSPSAPLPPSLAARPCPCGACAASLPVAAQPGRVILPRPKHCGAPPPTQRKTRPPIAVAPCAEICVGRTSRVVSLAARRSRAGAP